VEIINQTASIPYLRLSFSAGMGHYPRVKKRGIPVF